MILDRENIIEFARNLDTKILVAFSGGKDSVAMVLFLLFKLHIPKNRIVLCHHDIDGLGENLFDWAGTKSYCIAFADEFGIEILFSHRQGGILREIYRENEPSQDIYFQTEQNGEYQVAKSLTAKKYQTTRRKFMSVAMDLNIRWCSSKSKIDVMSRYINNTAEFKNAKLIICTGERREESTKREQYQEVEKYRSFSKTREAYQWRIVIDLTEDEVWNLLEEFKVQPHPAYMLGWGRCSCQLCIYNSNNSWASINIIDPDKIKRLHEIELDIDFTMYKDVSIYEKTKAGQNLLNEEDVRIWKDQALKKFTMPIIAKKWTRPKGANSIESCGAA